MQSGSFAASLMPFAAIGTGKSYAQSLMPKYITVHSLDIACFAAVNIIRQVKESVPYCGKHTQVWYRKRQSDNGKYIMAHDVRRLEQLFQEYEVAQILQFFKIVRSPNDGVNPDADETGDRETSERFSDLREAFREVATKIF